ncbi:TNT domain-containing protein [Cellulomonas sp. KH9]|uniref:TNT domain-containing protein n=1 Tax=Cellulomonas sp. KH9 TaxID=1855324 RepID=UPI0011604F49|nr:TNT domain-containing protein [Cellulomonas sp. KH9]
MLPVVDTHLDRAQALEQLRYGSMGGPLPVLDVDPAPVSVPFTTTPLDDGGQTLTWGATSASEITADRQDTDRSRDIGDWFADRWDDAADAVADGTQWVADKAGQAWDAVTDAGAAIGDWWERTTADLGEWIDTHLDGVREFIGRHVAIFRFLADALRIVGWVLVVVGAVLAVALAVIGAMGGTAAGAIFGFGVGAVPGGAAGAVAGLTFGLKILGVGFTLVSVGDFLDVAADWGEGKIDGQELVKLGSLELGLAVTSLIGVGVVGKILQKALTHLPASWRSRIDDILAPRRGVGGPRTHDEMMAPLRSDSPSGPGWVREPDVAPDAQYGKPRSMTSYPRGGSAPPRTIDPDVARLGGDLSHPWGRDPHTGLPFTEREWSRRYINERADLRWPPNDGAVAGSRVVFHDLERFRALYGDRFDRVGWPGGTYLGVPPGLAWGERALPPANLDRPVMGYTFTGRVPRGITVEVSEIAPAFGQPGGGIQVRFLRDGNAATVTDLLRWGVLA